jgi:hypothetical protein
MKEKEKENYLLTLRFVKQYLSVLKSTKNSQVTTNGFLTQRIRLSMKKIYYFPQIT